MNDANNSLPKTYYSRDIRDMKNRTRNKRQKRKPTIDAIKNTGVFLFTKYKQSN